MPWTLERSLRSLGCFKTCVKSSIMWKKTFYVPLHWILVGLDVISTIITISHEIERLPRPHHQFWMLAIDCFMRWHVGWLRLSQPKFEFLSPSPSYLVPINIFPSRVWNHSFYEPHLFNKWENLRVDHLLALLLFIKNYFIPVG